MRNICSIYRREIKSYFVSPIAYIVLTIFFIIGGFFFYQGVSYSQMANINGVLGDIAVVFLFLIPFLTMRLIAEEKKNGTLELLLTSPINPFQIIMGKFLSAMTIVLIAIGGTLLYLALLLIHSPVELGPIISGYLGLIFLSGSFVAVGVMASSLAESQMAAGIIGFGLSFLLMLINWAGQAGNGVLAVILREISPISHYMDFVRGIIDIKHVIFFLLWIVLFTSISTKSLEAKLLK